MAPLDLDPYSSYGSGSRTVKMMLKTDKNQTYQIEKRMNRLAEGVIVSIGAFKSSMKVFLAICCKLIFERKKFFHFCHDKNRYQNPDLDSFKPKKLDPETC